MPKLIFGGISVTLMRTGMASSSGDSVVIVRGFYELECQVLYLLCNRYSTGGFIGLLFKVAQLAFAWYEAPLHQKKIAIAGSLGNFDGREQSLMNSWSTLTRFAATDLKKRVLSGNLKFRIGR